MMFTHCDMCGLKIENGRCSCGIWSESEDFHGMAIRNALEEFHNMKQLTLTSDAPHLGCAVIFFRGDYNDCKKIEKLIYSMKSRPFYEPQKEKGKNTKDEVD